MLMADLCPWPKVWGGSRGEGDKIFPGLIGTSSVRCLWTASIDKHLKGILWFSCSFKDTFRWAQKQQQQKQNLWILFFFKFLIISLYHSRPLCFNSKLTSSVSNKQKSHGPFGLLLSKFQGLSLFDIGKKRTNSIISTSEWISKIYFDHRHVL